MSLPYFREFGWQPYVLAVAPTLAESVEPLLAETVPSDIMVERVRAVPLAITQRLGIGNVALRAWPALYRAGCRLIEEHGIDVVYFSTTMFFSMPLGRLWKRKYGTPYVLDMQDPWLSDYYETHPESTPPAKYSVARKLHAVLEPWTMKDAAAIIAVSPKYVDMLRGRYPWLTAAMCTVLPFGVSSRDFQLLESRPQANPFFQPSSEFWNGSYTGAAGDFMAPALRILLRGLHDGIATAPRLFERVRLHFIGTAYATDERAQKAVEPIAARLGVTRFVKEQTSRVPYFQALQVIKDSDCLILLGSDDPAYMASKLHSYVFAQKPILAIVHEASQMVSPLRQAGALVVTFSSGSIREEDATAELVCGWQELLQRVPSVRPRVAGSFDAYSARETTRQQCSVFDGVLARGRAMSAVPCTN